MRSSAPGATCRAWRDHDRFDAWLRRILVNACRDASRRGRRHEANVALAPDHDRPAPDASGSVVDRDAVSRGLATLSTDHRTVLVLHYYLELTLPEIGDALGTPVGTAKSRVHNARNALRSAIAGDRREDGA